MFWFLAALVAVIVAYVFARPMLLRLPAWQRVCDWIDPLVVSWLSRSRQIALARLTGILGVAVPFVSTVADIPLDWQALLDAIVNQFPAALQPWISKGALPILIWAYGELMRRATTQPLAEKA